MEKLSFLLFAIFCLIPFSEQGIIPQDKFEQKNGTDDGEGFPTTRGYESGVYLWPGGVVYYRYAKDTGNLVKQKLAIAMDTVTRATNGLIIFVYDTKSDKNLLVVFDGTKASGGVAAGRGCNANIGYHFGSINNMILSFGTSKEDCDTGKNGAGVAVHEIMHVLGFVHEFQRNDRESYFSVQKENVKKAFDYDETKYAINFNPRKDYTQGLPFDYKSIMNYDLAKFVDTKSNPPRKPDGVKQNMGHICGISAGDLNLIQITYREEGKRRRDYVPRTTPYTTFYPIPGETCDSRLKVMADEMS